MEERYRYIGKSVPRRDGIDIVTGRAQFLNDLNFSGLLHAKVLRSPHAHARIKRIDTRKAKSLEGVHAVVTWETIDDWRAGIPGIFRALDRTLRYVGDAVALVAAESEAIAEEATRRIEVTYEKFPAVLDDMEALKPGAPQLYEEFPGNRLPLDFPEFGPHSLKGIFMGNVDNGFAQADVVAEGNFAYDNIPNALPMESPGAVVFWQNPDTVTVWVSNQTAWLNKRSLSRIFGEKVAVRVIGGCCGGSFGTKIMSWQVQCYAAALSKATRHARRPRDACARPRAL